MAGVPTGFLLSLLAVILNKGRRAGIFGLLISIALVIWFCFVALC